MIIFLDASGRILETSKPATVGRNSNDASVLYIAAPISNNAIIYMTFRLPNGKTLFGNLADPKDPQNLSDDDRRTASYLFSVEGTDYSVWRYRVPASVTPVAGEVEYTIVTVTESMKTTSSGTFNVLPGSKIALPEGYDPTKFDDVLKKITEYAGAKVDTTTTPDIVYGNDFEGKQTTYPIDPIGGDIETNPFSVVRRGMLGEIFVPDPIKSDLYSEDAKNKQAANKAYVDSQFKTAAKNSDLDGFKKEAAKLLSVSLGEGYNVEFSLLNIYGEQIKDSKRTLDLSSLVGLTDVSLSEDGASLVFKMKNGSQVSVPLENILSGFVTETELATALADYVKNTDYATTSKHGLVKAGTGTSISGGVLSVDFAKQSDFENSTDLNKSITLGVLGHAVRAGLLRRPDTWTEKDKEDVRDFFGMSEIDLPDNVVDLAQSLENGETDKAPSVAAVNSGLRELGAELDEKLDKKTIDSGMFVYGCNDGKNDMIEVSGIPFHNKIPRYVDGRLLCNDPPSGQGSEIFATNKRYVDNATNIISTRMNVIEDAVGGVLLEEFIDGSPGKTSEVPANSMKYACIEKPPHRMNYEYEEKYIAGEGSSNFEGISDDISTDFSILVSDDTALKDSYGGKRFALNGTFPADYKNRKLIWFFKEPVVFTKNPNKDWVIKYSVLPLSGTDAKPKFCLVDADGNAITELFELPDANTGDVPLEKNFSGNDVSEVAGMAIVLDQDIEYNFIDQYACGYGYAIDIYVIYPYRNATIRVLIDDIIVYDANGNVKATYLYNPNLLFPLYLEVYPGGKIVFDNEDSGYNGVEKRVIYQVAKNSTGSGTGGGSGSTTPELPPESELESTLTSIDLSAYETDGTIVEIYSDGTSKTVTVEFDENGNPTRIGDVVLSW